MNNLTLICNINAKILYLKRNMHDKGSYFVMIPFKGYVHADYLSNFDDALYVRLTKQMLDNDDILTKLNSFYNKIEDNEESIESYSLDNEFGVVPDISIPDNLDPNFGQSHGIDVQIPDNLDSNFGQTHDVDVSIPNEIDPGFVYTPGSEMIEDIDDSYYIEYISSLNYVHYAALNELIDNDFSEDALLNFNTTFMNLFKEFFRYELNDPLDYVERAVIDFYSNGMWDDATILMTTIFDTMVSTTESSGCTCNNANVSNGCSSSVQGTNLINTGTAMVNIDNATCIEKYKAAMFQWLQNMLSDYKFYCKWMMIDSEDGERIPETTIIDKTILLLNLLLESEYDLNNLGSSNTSGCGHRHGKKSDCGDYTDSNNGTACTNYSVIKNYIKVLEYVKNDEVLENKNKIYIYGKAFASILPLLSF